MACSNCLLTQNLTPNCQVNVPGGNGTDVYITNCCYVDKANITYNADGVITAIPLVVNIPPFTWFLMTGRKDTVSSTETGDATTLAVTSDITLSLGVYNDNVSLPGGFQNANDFMQEIRSATQGFVILMQDRAGTWRAYGIGACALYNGDVKASGLTATDQFLFALNFQAFDGYNGVAVDAAVIASLVVAP